MADWIAVAVDVLDDPEVIALAVDLGVTPPALVGHLVGIWGKMSAHARRGNIASVNDSVIESWARWNGPANLLAVKFREVFAPKGRVKNWDRWNGKLQRSKELSVARAKKWREQHARERNAQRTRTVRVTNANGAHNEQGTQHDTTQHNTTKKRKSISRIEDPMFEAFWAAYPKRPGNPRGRAEEAWTARRAEGISPETLVDAAKAYAGYIARERKDPQFIKLAATFLGPSRAWEDDYGPVVGECPAPSLPNGEINPAFAEYIGIPLPR